MAQLDGVNPSVETICEWHTCRWVNLSPETQYQAAVTWVIWEPRFAAFALEGVDLALAMSRLIELRSLIDELHPMADDSMDQPGKLCGHGLDGNRSLLALFSVTGTVRPDSYCFGVSSWRLS